MPLSYSITTRLQYQHETMPELVKGFSGEQLKIVVNPGKWSVFENMAHLTAYQPVFLKRLQLIEQNENPLFERYVAENDPGFHTCLKYPLKELQDDLCTQRFLLHKHIIQLGETTLRRTGIHPKFGQLSVSQWTDFFLLHEAHHLFTIFMLVAELRKMLQQ
jgi:DinB superfamily